MSDAVKVRIATCLTLPEVDVDEVPLMDALARAGFDAKLVGWDDPAVDWNEPVPTVLRSTWNYAQQHEAFLAWIDRVSRVAPLLNPPDVVHANVHKRYLVELASRAVPVVPTTIVEQGGQLAASHVAAPRIVVKPEVGAGSFETRTFAPDDPEAARHVAKLARTGAVLVQPYVDSVETYGERSIVWIDGELTHAIRKTPRFAGDAERIDGPFPIADDEAAVALAALAPYTDRILYGRVDLARDDAGRPMVMELELIEPSLFFLKSARALDRFLAGLSRRLAAR